MFAGVSAGGEASADHLLTQWRRVAAERRHPVDHVDDDAESVEIVEHHDVEWGRRGPHFLVAAHVEVVVVVRR